MQPRPPRIRPQWPLFQPFRQSPQQPSLRITSQPSHNHRQTRTIRSIVQKPKPYSRFNNSPSIPALLTTPGAALVRKNPNLPLRTGALATKKGMTAVYDTETGKRLAATVLQLDRVQVVAHKTRERHGYFAVCLGTGWRHPRRVGRAMMGVFAGAKTKDMHGGEVGLAPKAEVKEFRVRSAEGLLPVGTSIGPSWFKVGQWVDTRSNTRGMGFAGGMKRHGFTGQPASHGVSLTHRSMGSAGGSQGSGSRVHPGKRMAGNMGGERHTVQNLKVLMIDESNGIVVVNGAVSGPKGCTVKISDAVKKPWPEILPQSTEGDSPAASATV